jgi:two-component system response regulator YesN
VYRVLIVDDEEPVLESYAFMVGGAADFALIGKARSGYDALALIHEQKPDLVFMDINIPGIDGLEVIAEVHRKFPGMIFILSTA